MSASPLPCAENFAQSAFRQAIAPVNGSAFDSAGAGGGRNLRASRAAISAARRTALRGCRAARPRRVAASFARSPSVGGASPGASPGRSPAISVPVLMSE